MEYIVFDLEFNQGFDEKTNKTIPNERCPFEILQIGALKLDKDLNIIDTFNSYVKPKIYNRVHPFITNMTGITNKMVKDAPDFPDVYKKFKRFIGKKDNIFCVWGSGDLKELYRNVYYYGLPHKTIPKLYINVQSYASAYFKNPSGKSIGLQNAIQLLEIEQTKSYHDAFNDAYYTTEILKVIYSDEIVADTYIYTPFRPRNTSPRVAKKIDYTSLFREFEKILSRPLTEEEAKIIDLAYKMGKTRQFLVDDESKKKKKDDNNENVNKE